MKNLSAIRATVRQFLRDEFDPDIDREWEDDELDIYIQDCLVEVSEKRPYEVKETLKTTAGSKELNISSIENLIKVLKVEYPTGREPPNYRNCSVFGSTLRMDIAASPAANQDVYLYCWKIHQLTEAASTLNTQLERVLVLGACTKAAIAKSRTMINKVPVGGGRVASELHSWGITKMAEYRGALKSITKPRMKQEYPTGGIGSTWWEHW